MCIRDRQGSGVANIDVASVEIRLGDDGNYTLYTGSSDMGMGCLLYTSRCV